MSRRTILGLGILAVLLGCQTPDSPAPRVVVAATGKATATQLAAQQAAIDALKEEKAKAAELAQRAAGGVYGGAEANTHNPDGLPKEAVAAQLAEAASALPEPTAEQKLEKANQNARILAGELAAVKVEMGQTISENQALKTSLSAAEQRAVTAEKDAGAAKAAAEKERAEAAGKLQRQFDDMSARIAAEQRKVQEAADAAKKAALQRLGWVLLGLGALFTLVGAFQAYATVQAGDLTPKGFLKPLVWAGAAAFCFACFWTVNQPWFKWLVIGGGSASILGGGLFLYAEWQEAKDRRAGKARAVEADEAEETLKHMIAVGDALPETTTLKDYLEALGRRMSDPHKALLHELRGETKRTKST